MKNNKTTISASEISKFTYCNYQWYYGRLFGNPYIVQKYKERNREYNMDNTALSNLNKGLKFHSRYTIFKRLKTAVKIIILISVAIGVYYVYSRLR